MRALSLVLILTACGGKGEDESARLHFSSSTIGVASAGGDLITALGEESTKSADLGDSMTAWKKIGTAIEKLDKALSSRETVALTGELESCAKAWYQASDELKTALQPVISGLPKANVQPLEMISTIKFAWQKNERAVQPKLCGLVTVAETCDRVIAGSKTPKLGISFFGQYCTR